MLGDRIQILCGVPHSRLRFRVDRQVLREEFRLDCDVTAMRDLFSLFAHLVVTTVRLMRPGGAPS